MSTATSARGYKRPWLRFINCERTNNALKLTRSARHIRARPLQLSAVLGGRGDHPYTASSGSGRRSLFDRSGGFL
jgi:hypothetical protein